MAIFDSKRSNLTPQIKPLRGEKNFIKFLLSLLLQFDFTTKNSQNKGKKPFLAKKNGHF